LDDLRDWLNNKFLPTFGRPAMNVEFDYVDPVPTDREADSNELAVKVDAVVKLVGAGANWDDALETVGLPPMRFSTAPAAVPVGEQGPQLENARPVAVLPERTG